MQYLHNLIVSIISIYFVDLRCVLHFTEHQKLASSIDNFPIIHIQLNSSGGFDSSIMQQYFGCKGFVIISDTPQPVIKHIEHVIRHSLERFSERKYIIISRNSTRNRQLFAMAELHYISDVLLIAYRQTGFPNIWKTHEQHVNVTFYTHQFVGFTGGETLVRLDDWRSFEEKYISGVNLFPDKLTNGMGRPWRIASFNYRPYSVPDYREGAEFRMAWEFGLHHNMTRQVIIDDVNEWGEIFENWTSYGMFGYIMHDKADTCFASVCSWFHEYQYMDLSKPMIRAGVTTIAPAPRLAGGWFVPLFSFTSDMWIAVAITFVGLAFLFALIDYYTMRKHNLAYLLEESILDMITIILLQAYNRFGNSSRAKTFLYGAVFIFAMLLASSYGSGLASAMMAPHYVGAIKTLQQLADSNIRWGATSTVWITSISTSEIYKYKKAVQLFFKADHNTLAAYNKKRFAYGVERLTSGYFAIGDYVSEEGASRRRLMDEDIYWDHTVQMMKKSSVYTPLVDKLLLNIAQSGIERIWEFRAATGYLNAKIQQMVAFSSKADKSALPVKLRWDHVEGAFAVLVIGYSLALLRLIFEVYKARCNKK